MIIRHPSSTMKLSLRIYRQIIARIEAHSSQKESLQSLAQEFPHVPHGTLLSIYSQHYQVKTKRSHWSHRKPETMSEYYRRYLAARERKGGGGDDSMELILEMSQQVSLSPTLFARIILEQFATDKELVPPGTAPNTLISQWIKNPSAIPDHILQLQVRACVLNDPNYGPLADNVKRSVGYEYEFLLKEKVEELGIPFLDEHALRARGYDKTPDLRLEVPIAVDGQVVNWIESKASFGDEVSHDRNLQEQLWSYQNRFGSGLVIYWFGFIKELDTHRDQGITLADAFPDRSSIVTLAAS